MSLPTLLNTVQKLQKALQAKAKAEPNYRFYSLWDKVYRRDVLWQAYRHCRANNGAPGVDRVTFDQIETEGVGPWLAKLQEELRNKSYRSQPLLRIWISKSNGGQRPLGIPTLTAYCTSYNSVLEHQTDFTTILDELQTHSSNSFSLSASRLIQ